jgi:hypothetical protein
MSRILIKKLLFCDEDFLILAEESVCVPGFFGVKASEGVDV